MLHNEMCNTFICFKMLPALFLVVGMNTGTGTGTGTGTMTGVGVVYMARGVGMYTGTGTGMKYLSGSVFPSVMSYLIYYIKTLTLIFLSKMTESFHLKQLIANIPF